MAGPRWARYYGDSQGGDGYCVRPAPGGGYVAGGDRDFSFWLLRVDSLGDSLWAIRVHYATEAVCLLSTDDSDWLVVGGYSHSDTSGFCITKVSDVGETLWSRLYLDRALMMAPRAIARGQNGGFLIVGEAHDTGGPGIAVEDGYVVRFDRDGNYLWSKRYVALGDDEFQAVLRPEQGGYLLAGSTFDDTLTTYEWAWLVRVDDNGDTVWTRKCRADSNACEGFEGVVQASDGGYVLAGGVATDTSPGSYCLGKTDSAGNLEWFRTYGGLTGEDCAFAVCATADSGYALIGQCSSHGAGSYDAWLVKTDALGNLQWSKTYGGTDWDQGNDIATTPDNGFIIAGQTWSTPNHMECVYLIKTDSTGSAAILEGPRGARRVDAPVSLRLGPSVVTGLHVTASYSIPEFGPVEIAFYDVTGQRLAVLSSGHRTAGRHEETLVLPDRRGVGYVRIVTPSGSATAKLVMSGP